MFVRCEFRSRLQHGLPGVARLVQEMTAPISREYCEAGVTREPELLKHSDAESQRERCT